jgi:hypothetical protein
VVRQPLGATLHSLLQLLLAQLLCRDAHALLVARARHLLYLVNPSCLRFLCFDFG